MLPSLNFANFGYLQGIWFEIFFCSKQKLKDLIVSSTISTEGLINVILSDKNIGCDWLFKMLAKLIATAVFITTAIACTVTKGLSFEWHFCNHFYTQFSQTYFM